MKNFSISLYAFHLRQSLDNALDEVDEDAATLLWRNLVEQTALPFPNLKDLYSHLICYENGKYNSKLEQGKQTYWLINSGSLDLGSINIAENFAINGNLQAFLLNDTYAVDLTLLPTSEGISIEPEQLLYFQYRSLLPKSIQASLGQTLWIYGETDKNDEECHELALKYVKALLQETDLQIVKSNFKKDYLLKSLVFEFETIDPQEPENPTKQCQILVSINNNQAQTPQLAEKAYNCLLELLCCRHKIQYINWQARQCYINSRKINSRFSKYTEKFHRLIADSQGELEELENLLIKMSPGNLDYALCLGDLKAHHTAIVTNIANYYKCLEEIADTYDSPKLWKDFVNHTCKRWQTQIELDINFLSPTQEQFEQMIDVTRCLVDVKLVQSNRETNKILREKEESLQSIIAMVGFGVGFSGIGATTSFYILSQEPKPTTSVNSFISNKLYPITHSLLFIIIYGVIGGLIARGFSSFIHRIHMSKKQTENKSPNLKP